MRPLRDAALQQQVGRPPEKHQLELAGQHRQTAVTAVVGGLVRGLFSGLIRDVFPDLSREADTFSGSEGFRQ